MSTEDQELWKAECCSEKAILRGSERELMCESILPEESKSEYTERDLEPVDNGIASYVGEDEELVWTKRGVESSLGEPAWAKEGKVVNDGFLRFQPLTVQEGLKWGFWKVQNKATRLSNLGFKPKSLLETSAHRVCDLSSLKTCDPKLKDAKQRACQEEGKWTHVSDIETSCKQKQNPPVYVKDPNLCSNATFKGAGAIYWHYFEYNKNQQTDEDPVLCYVKSENYQCEADRTPKAKKRIRGFDKVWFWQKAN